MSTVSSVASTSGSSVYNSSDVLANPSQTLNQNDFLKLLVSQIQYQDPMNPKSDTDMASQMAQFTALQQASQSTSSLSMMQANGLVGSTVKLQVDSKNTASGVVSGVQMKDGAPQIVVNGNYYSLSQITAVAPTPITTTPSSSQTN